MAVEKVTPRERRTEMVAEVVAEVVARTVVTAIVWERVVLSTPVSISVKTSKQWSFDVAASA